MDGLFPIYFENGTKRYFLVTHLIYLLMCLLMVNKVMCSWFDMCYSFPKEINTAMILSFIMSGQIIMPLVLFIFTAFFLHAVKVSALWFYYIIRIQGRRFINVDAFIIKVADRYQWFKYHNNTWIKGKKFSVFKKHLDEFVQDKFNMVDAANVYNTLLISASVNVLIYDIPWIQKIIVCSLLFLYFIFHCMHMFFLFSIQDCQDRFIDIRNIIESPTP